VVRAAAVSRTKSKGSLSLTETGTRMCPRGLVLKGTVTWVSV
jgi:hypothetical protein